MYAGQWMRCQSSDRIRTPKWGQDLMAWSMDMDTKIQRVGTGRNGRSSSLSVENCLIPSKKIPCYDAIKRLEVVFTPVSATAWPSPRRGFGQPAAWRSRPDCCCSPVDSVGLAAHCGWLAGTAPLVHAVDPEPEVVPSADCHDLQ